MAKPTPIVAHAFAIFASLVIPNQASATSASTQEWNVIDQAERIVADMPDAPSIDEDGGTQAFYIPSKDGIHMPPKHAFDDADE